MLTVAALVGLDLWHSRAAAQDEAGRLLARNAATAGRYLSERLSALDASLAHARLGLGTGGEVEPTARPDLHRHLQALSAHDPLVRELFVLDRDGKLVATSRMPVPGPSARADREAFAAQRSDGSPTLRLVAAWDGSPAAVGSGVIAMSRPVILEDGRIGGVVVGVVDAAAVTEHFLQSAHGPGVRLAAFAPDGRLIAGDEEVTRRALASCAAPAGRPAAAAPVGEPEWIVACTAVHGYGLTSSAAAPAEASARAWTIEARYKIGGVLGLAACSLVIASMRRRITQAQQRSSILSTAIEQSSNAVVITDADGVIQWANAALTEQSGYAIDEIVGATPSLLKSGLQPASYYDAMWRTIVAGRVWRGEIFNRKKTGELYRVRQVITPLMDSHGKASHFVAIEEDVTGVLEGQALLERVKTTDLFTGLPNRAGFQDGLGAIRLSTGRDLVGVLDLAGLSAVNGSAGRAVGDQALLQVAEALLRDRRVIAAARIGDDEFGFVLSTDGAADGPPEAITTLHAAIEADIRRIEGCGMLSARVGYAVADSDMEDNEVLLERSELALNAGRGRSAGAPVRYSRDLAERSARQQKLKHALRGALDAGEISFLLQPKVVLPEGRIVGGELLMRWTQHELGPVSPAEFIPLAEQTGDILRLGRAALDAALRVAARIPPDAEFRVAVNASAVELSRPDFADGVIDALQRAGVRPGRLVVELTETAAATGGTTLRDQLRRLLDAGIGVDLDDFGTGYATLSQLRDLPFSGIKIDREFVAPLLEDRHSQLIVRGVIALATSLGAAVVAEGIENVETARALAELGCGYGQGYLYGRPAEPEALLARLPPVEG